MRKVLTATLAAVLVPAAGIAPAHAATAPVPTSVRAPHSVPLGDCSPGELCLWAGPDFNDTRAVHESADTDIGSCVPLPAGVTAKSLANRTRRLVTTYQSAECATEGDFVTFPSGVWVPRSRHTVRAFQIVDQ